MKHKYKITTGLILSLIIGFYFGRPNSADFTQADFNKWKVEQKIQNQNNAKPGHPDKAYMHYVEQRMYPNNSIPEGWREKAYDHIQKNNSLEKGNFAAFNWTNVGPNNVPGRTRSILIDPNNTQIMYSGSVSGGVWKSTTGGSNWFPLNDHMDNLAVVALAMDPSNSSIIYAGTGEGFFNVDALRGAGIFKSTNAGVTWSKLASTNIGAFAYVYKIMIDGTTNTIWAGTATGLFKSNNGGTSFSQVAGIGARVTDIEIGKTTPTTIYAAAGHFAQSIVHASTDGGVTFGHQATSPNQGRAEIATSESSPNVAYVSFHNMSTNGVTEMYKTTDQGLFWGLITVPGPSFSGANNYAGGQAWYDNILAVNPSNANHVYAGGVDLWSSTDGGLNWTQKTNWYAQAGAPPQVHADFHEIKFDPTNSNTVFVGNDGGIYKSQNSGTSWSRISTGLVTTQFYYGAAHPTNATYYGGTQDNGTLKSQSGSAWNEILGGDGGATEVDFSNANNIYMEYVNLAFFKSTDGGGSYNKMMNGIPHGPNPFDGTTDRTLFISPFTMDPSNSSIINAGTYRVWQTTNGAASWAAISGDLTVDGSSNISTLVSAKSSSNTIYVGCTNGVLQVTTNNGSSWNRRDTGLPNLYCTKIAIEDGNDANAVAVFSGYNSGQKVYRTTNHGVSWTNISNNLPNIPVSSVFIHPTSNNYIVVGTDLGVFSSANTGGSWQQMNSGMANVSVVDLDYKASTGKLLAATHGRGMYVANLSDLTDVDDDKEQLISDYKLEQNYPNPFNPSTKIKYTIPAIRTNSNTSVRISVYDILGNEVALLVNEEQPAGNYEVEFNANNYSSGVYFYSLQTSSQVLTKKMILLK